MSHLFYRSFLKATIIGGTSYLCARAFGVCRSRTTKCCGIIASISKTKQAEETIIEGLMPLKSRSYTSAGIASIQKGKIVISRIFSETLKGQYSIEETIKQARSLHNGSQVAMAHVQYVTNVQSNNTSAHLLTDNKSRLAMVHTGSIQNYFKLKEDMIKQGHSFSSETDSEVVTTLIGNYVDCGFDLLESVKKATTLLEGTWAMAIMHIEDPKSFILCRKGNSLLIGFNDAGICISSEQQIFEKSNIRFVSLMDKEVVKVNIQDDASQFFENRLQTINSAFNNEIKCIGKFEHYFIKEIMEQPESVMMTLKNFGRLDINDGRPRLTGFDDNRLLALSCERILFIGSGSSYNAALCGAYMLKRFGIFDSVDAVESSNVMACDFPQPPFGCICITQSGESIDVMKAMDLARKQGSVNMGVVNTVDSLVTTVCKFGTYMNCGKENSIAATKSFTSSIVVLQLIAMWFAYHKALKKTFEIRMAIAWALHDLPSLISTTLLANKDKASKLAGRVAEVKSLFVLGQGLSYPIAREMAIKMKEVCYIHAEAFPLGEFRHGSLALIEPCADNKQRQESVVIVIVQANEGIMGVTRMIELLKTNRAFVIVVSDCPHLLEDQKVDFLFEVPSSPFFTSLLCLYPIQLLAYEVAKLKGLNPDKPRHLTKAVTTL